MKHFTTARNHYYNRLDNIERISTGSRNIDAILCGGVETKAVTEFYGAPGSGKTQLCHTMCAIASQAESAGGVRGKSIYIDTEGKFRDERIAQIAIARGFEPNRTLDNVIILEAQDRHTQERIMDDIDSLLKDTNERFMLLVVDSPITHYRSEYIGRENLPQRQQKLFKFMRRLVKVAHTYNIAVVVTNHINTTPNSRKLLGKSAGGNAMGHAATYRVRFWTANRSIYYSTIVNSPYHPQNTKTFYIGEEGLQDDNPNPKEDFSTKLSFGLESFFSE
jgi:DNA repair protein RadA